MPLYEYRCADCGVVFEKLRPMGKADAPANCANCGSAATTRALSLFAAVSRSNGGESHAIRGTSGGCTSCGGGSCATCSH